MARSRIFQLVAYRSSLGTCTVGVAFLVREGESGCVDGRAALWGGGPPDSYTGALKRAATPHWLRRMAL